MSADVAKKHILKDVERMLKGIEDSESAALSVIVPISPKTFGGYNDSLFRERVKSSILREVGPWDRQPLLDASIILKFGLSEDRFRNGNDLDNLAKLVLDALSLEVKSKGTIWRGYGIIRNDSDALDLVLIKRLAQPEYIKILVYPWDVAEEFHDAVLKELRGAIISPITGIQKKYIVFEDLNRATGPKVHSIDCSYYKRWLKNPTTTTTWHGPFDALEEARKICEKLSIKSKFKCSEHSCARL